MRRLYEFCSVKLGDDIFVLGGNSSVRFSLKIPYETYDMHFCVLTFENWKLL